VLGPLKLFSLRGLSTQFRNYQPGSLHEALITLMANRLPGQTPLSLIKRELGLKPNGMKALTACLRDAEHPTTKALEAMKVKYVGGKGRGAKSYLVKAA
jgi:hypothetical protein